MAHTSVDWYIHLIILSPQSTSPRTYIVCKLSLGFDQPSSPVWRGADMKTELNHRSSIVVVGGVKLVLPSVPYSLQARPGINPLEPIRRGALWKSPLSVYSSKTAQDNQCTASVGMVAILPWPEHRGGLSFWASYMLKDGGKTYRGFVRLSIASTSRPFYSFYLWSTSWLCNWRGNFFQQASCVIASCCSISRPTTSTAIVDLYFFALLWISNMQKAPCLCRQSVCS